MGHATRFCPPKLLSTHTATAEVPLPKLLVLQETLEFSALLLVEDLLDLGFAFAQYRAVVLPEVIEDGLHLLLLGRREVEFPLHPREIEFPAHGGVEGRLVQTVVQDR